MIDAAERAAMEESVRAAIAGADGNAAVDEVLRKLDWLELLAAEPADAIEIVFGALGASNRAATALDDVLASALGLQPRADLAVLLPPFAAWNPPGRIEARAVHARGLATARAASARELLVVCGTASEPRAASVPIRDAEVRAVRGVDPDGGLHQVRLQGSVTACHTSRLATRGKRRSLSAGARSRTRSRAPAEPCWPSRAATRSSACSSVVRSPNSRPCATDSRTRSWRSSPLEATLAAAREEPGPETAALAKATAGRTARTVAAHCQQVLAGVGFTTEHAFHRFFKRTLALEGLFGSADEIVLDVGKRLLAQRRVPTLIEL